MQCFVHTLQALARSLQAAVHPNQQTSASLQLSATDLQCQALDACHVPHSNVHSYLSPGDQYACAGVDTPRVSCPSPGDQYACAGVDTPRVSCLSPGDQYACAGVDTPRVSCRAGQQPACAGALGSGPHAPAGRCCWVSKRMALYSVCACCSPPWAWRRLLLLLLLLLLLGCCPCSPTCTRATQTSHAHVTSACMQKQRMRTARLWKTQQRALLAAHMRACLPAHAR